MQYLPPLVIVVHLFNMIILTFQYLPADDRRCLTEGGCQQGCLFLSRRVICYCRDGYQLQPDRKTCTVKMNKKAFPSKVDGMERVLTLKKSTDIMQGTERCRGDLCENLNRESKPYQNNNNSKEISREQTPTTKVKHVAKSREMFIETLITTPAIMTKQSLSLKKGNEKIPTYVYDQFEEMNCKEGEVIVNSPAGKICERKNQLSACTPGQTKTNKNGILDCIKTFSSGQSLCPDNERPELTIFGVMCFKSERYRPEKVTAQLKSCPPGEELVKIAYGSICRKIPSTRPVCSGGQVLVQLGSDFYCMTQTTTAPPCPDGMVPTQSPIGIICQMSSQFIPAPTGKFKSTCGPGQRLVKTPTGEECWFLSSSALKTECPAGQVLIDGTVCKSPEMISPDEQPCPINQELVMTQHGVVCQFRRNKMALNKNNLQVTKCPAGQILTQTTIQFLCLPLRVDISDVICDVNEVIIQREKSIVECINEEETNMFCEEGNVLVREANGFTCRILENAQRLVENYKLCDKGKVLIQDKNDRKCVLIENNPDVCGDNYQIVASDDGFLCKPKNLVHVCPEGSILENKNCISSEVTDTDGQTKTDNPCFDNKPIKTTSECRNFNSVKELDCNPDCANGGTCVNGSCLCVAGVTGTGCTEDIDECVELHNICQFNCTNTFGSYGCKCPNGTMLKKDGHTCQEMGCLSACLNGGVCRNGKCRCSKGFTGEFCQEDVNECSMEKGRCDYICRNTYGSYVCICPPGTRLLDDKSTCKNTTCRYTCVNGGRCRRNRCVCPSGYSGVICQLEIDECFTMSPCSDICVNTPGSYYCQCKTGRQLMADGHTCTVQIYDVK